MKPVSYVLSYLDTETPLARKRLLGVKGAKAARGESVTAAIELKPDPNLDFMRKAVAAIRTAMNARQVKMPDGVKPRSKYSAKIS